MILKRSNIVTISIDHRGNVAGGFNHQSVDWQLRQQRRMQDNHTRQVQDTFESAPYLPIPRNKNHIYWKELEEVLPQKIKLAKELQMLLKPVNTYNSWNHKTKIYGTPKCLDNPLNIIRNAYSMKVDTYQYQKNRSYYSNLYKSMRNADISHQDILSVYGNPYIGTVTKWNELSWQRKQSLKLQYPEMEKLAEDIAEQRRSFYDKVWWNICDPAKRFLDEYGFAISAIASTHPYGKATVGLVRTGQAIVAIAPKMVKLITTLGSVELARQFQILYKKNNDGNSAKPRHGTSGYKEGKYWSGLTDSVKGLKNLGMKSKDAQGMFGDYLRLKKIDKGGEIRMDKYGNFYKFDRAHQTAKIHLEKIEKRGNTFYNTAEVDAETGIVTNTFKYPRKIGK